MTEPILRIQDLSVRYGEAQALVDVSVDVPTGSALAVLGANGAGKSTLARCVSGLISPFSGKSFFGGHEITHMPAYRIRRLGLTYVPEGRGIFRGLSVEENLRMAVSQGKRDQRKGAIDRAVEMFPPLSAHLTRRAGTLSGGEQQMLALAGALAVPPKMIIADEISLGLAPQVVEAVFACLEAARQAGTTLVLSEQFVHRALSLADNCLILSHGRVGWYGPASEASEEVMDQYLGEADRASRITS